MHHSAEKFYLRSNAFDELDGIKLHKNGESEVAIIKIIGFEHIPTRFYLTPS